MRHKLWQVVQFVWGGWSRCQFYQPDRYFFFLINSKLWLKYQEDKFFYQANPSIKANVFGQQVSSSTSTQNLSGNFWVILIIIISISSHCVVLIDYRRLFIHIRGLFLVITGVLQFRQIQSASVPGRVCGRRLPWHGNNVQWRGQTLNSWSSRLSDQMEF